MDLTLEKFDDLLRMLLDRAKTNRQRLGYKSQDFAQAVVVVGPQCEQAVMPVGWNTAKEKHAVMYAIKKAAQVANASAVVLIADSRWTDSDRFSVYFHIPTPKEIGIEEWQERFDEIRKRYGKGDMQYLPREVWEEAVVVIGKGPLVGVKSLIAPYREIVGDGVEWFDSTYQDNGKEYVSKMLMLDDWWTETTKQ